MKKIVVSEKQAWPPSQVSGETLDQLLNSVAAGEVVMERAQLCWTTSYLDTDPHDGDTYTAHRDESRVGFMVGDREVHEADYRNLGLALEARKEFPELQQRLKALLKRPGWTHRRHEYATEAMEVVTLSARGEYNGGEASFSVRHIIDWVWKAKASLTQWEDKILPVLNPLAARGKEEGVELYFGGVTHTTGQTGRAAFYVITPDGSLRPADYHRSGSFGRGENSAWWRCVEPAELAIDWSKRGNADPHQFHVDKLPKGGVCTPEQLAAVGRLEDAIEEEWEGRQGFSSRIPSPPVGEGWGLGAPRSYDRRVPAAPVARESDPLSPFAKLAGLREKLAGK